MKHLRERMVQNRGIHSLSHDLIINILLKLPPKTLCKFRCVSKLWFNLLTKDKEFINKYTQLHKKQPLLLIRRYISDENGGVSKTKATVELTSLDMDGNIKDKFKTEIHGIVHSFISCGPLALMCCIDSLYVVNPSFHEVTEVPFYSRTHLGIFGFGHLPNSGEYKIIHMFEDYSFSRRESNIACEVLTFTSKEDISYGYWKRILGDCPSSASTDTHSLCVDGSVFWSRSFGRKDRSILSFDLEKEDFRIIKGPDHHSDTYGFRDVTGIKGCLFVIGFSLERKAMNVWRFDKNENLWAMDHRIDVFPFFINFLVSSDYGTNEILMHTEDKGLIWYKMKDQTSRKIKFFEGVRSNNRPCLYHYTISSLDLAPNRS